MKLSNLTEVFKSSLKDVNKKAQKHAPELLAGAAVIGIVSTAILSGQATAKAVKVLDEKYPDEKPTKVEVIKEVGKYYIPTALAVVGSSLCVLKSNSIHLRRNAALATAYSISNSAYKEYRSKVKEVLGEKKAKTIDTEISKDKVVNNPMPSDAQYYVTGNGTTRCYDTVFGQRFLGNVENIQKIEAILNLRMRDENYISVNDLFYELGIPPIKIGDDLGWNSDDGNIEFMYDAQLDDDNVPIIVLSYICAPKYDFRRGW